MRSALLLTTVALLAAACAAPDAFADGFDASAPPARLIDANDMPTMRAAADLTPWTAYRTFRFDAAAVDISPFDLPKISEIVAYLATNPSLDVGIDGTLAAAGTSAADRSLGSRRATAIRRALMDAGAGVSSYKIFVGAFAAPDRRNAGQIQVLVGPRTGSLSAGL